MSLTKSTTAKKASGAGSEPKSPKISEPKVKARLPQGHFLLISGSLFEEDKGKGKGKGEGKRVCVPAPTWISVNTLKQGSKKMLGGASQSPASAGFDSGNAKGKVFEFAEGSQLLFVETDTMQAAVSLGEEDGDEKRTESRLRGATFVYTPPSAGSSVLEKHHSDFAMPQASE